MDSKEYMDIKEEMNIKEMNVKEEIDIKEEMDSNKDVIRVKEEPSDTVTNTADEFVIDLVGYCKSENFQGSSSHELSSNHRNEVKPLLDDLNETVFNDFECKDVKLELKPLAPIVIKSEYGNVQPVIKIENEVQTDCDDNCKSKENSCFKFSDYEKLQNSENHVEKKSSSYASKMCLKTARAAFGKKEGLKRHMIVHNLSKPFKCDICHKSFGLKAYLRRHLKEIHDRSKTFECNICHKLFVRNCSLKSHMNAVHNRIKTFECDVCHRSFGRKDGLKSHMNFIHNPTKPFECDICHLKVGQKLILDTERNAVIFLGLNETIKWLNEEIETE
ncbi:zinc finger and SCAN domain-containing protein 12-like [Trichogramma pretiosum]|uniref:zinc finger and SCAN domain-containing protein 12-like n=1 Tax=Trichogramma pretiosum TaxID=7493 RepID=UPI0006C9B568|nr:zinc finger and SCAN domain-containing protein 12-like [Trichogramma pretiosum]